MDAKHFAPVRTFLIGLTALLPVVVTIGIIAWVANFLMAYVGPGSVVGRWLTRLGWPVSDSQMVAYAVGCAVVLLAVFLLGFGLERGFQGVWTRVTDRPIRRVPLVGRIYEMTSRFVEVFDRKDGEAIRSMSPVWCCLGGEGGTAVLALMPNPEVVEMGGRKYRGVLVPTAPVPFGGGLLFVPEEWVRPANFGVETLTSIYLSMGVTLPPSLLARGQASAKEPKGEEAR